MRVVRLLDVYHGLLCPQPRLGTEPHAPSMSARLWHLSPSARHHTGKRPLFTSALQQRVCTEEVSPWCVPGCPLRTAQRLRQSFLLVGHVRYALRIQVLDKSFDSATEKVLSMRNTVLFK
jgi:hypothetical protein